MIDPDEENKVKSQSVTVVAAALFPIIWQSIVEAFVVFFTTLGLESWWHKEEKAKKKRKKKAQ